MTQYRFLWAISAALLIFLIVAGYAIQRYAIPKLEPLPSQTKNSAQAAMVSKPASVVLAEAQEKPGASAATGDVEAKPDPMGPPVTASSAAEKKELRKEATEPAAISAQDTKAATAATPSAPPAVHVKAPPIQKAIEHTTDTPAPEPPPVFIMPAPIQLPLQ